MLIKAPLRRELEKLLPKNYRQVVVDRLKAKKKTVHPNTVYNVLHGSQNDEVALEIIKLYNEKKEESRVHQRIADAIVADAA